jgi:hypothetical protein
MTTHRLLGIVLSLLPVMLGRVRLVAALAGGAWLAGMELDVTARAGLVLIALAVIVLDTVLTPPQALAEMVRGRARTEGA